MNYCIHHGESKIYIATSINHEDIHTERGIEQSKTKTAPTSIHLRLVQNLENTSLTQSRPAQ